MKSSETACSGATEMGIVETLGDLETLFALMRTFKVGVVQIGELKVVLEPDHAPLLAQRGHAVPEMPARSTSVHDDPLLYSDGEVPTFGR